MFHGFAQYVRGEIDAAALTAMAKTTKDRTRATCWLGYEAFLAGRIEPAQELFTQTLHEREHGVFEFFIATCMLDRIERLRGEGDRD